MSDTQLSLFDVEEPPGDATNQPSRVASPVSGSSHELGRAHELLLDEEGARNAAGAFYTPEDVVEGLLDLSLQHLLERCATSEEVALLRVIDPACGSGNFLAAAAQRISARLMEFGMPEPEAVAVAHLECVVGVDRDREAADICRSVLVTCGGVGHSPLRAPKVFVLDSLAIPLVDQPSLFSLNDSGPASWAALKRDVGATDGFDLVIGNPPFLNQLESETAVGAAGLAQLRARFGDAVGAYTDLAAVFLLLACEVVRPSGGVVCFIEPISLLSARHAQLVRERVLERSHLRLIWFATERVFDAAVDVCAVLLESGSEDSITSVVERRTFTSLGSLRAPSRHDVSWSYLLAAQRRLPDRAFATGPTLATIAHATADFRDQYYGLADHVRDQVAGDPTTDPPLITAGLIDPARCLWGSRSTKFNKRSYLHPRVHIADLESKLRQWAQQRLVPKILLATQTRILEVIVDPDGHLLPSVPVITITADLEDLWRVGAMLSSPPVTLVAAQRHLGAGLSADGLKLSASDVLALPLPSGRDAWDRAAGHFRAACIAAPDETREHLALSAQEMCVAYGVPGDEELMTWWNNRFRRR